MMQSYPHDAVTNLHNAAITPMMQSLTPWCSHYPHYAAITPTMQSYPHDAVTNLHDAAITPLCSYYPHDAVINPMMQPLPHDVVPTL